MAYAACCTTSLKQRVLQLTPIAIAGIMATLPDAGDFRCLEILLERSQDRKQGAVIGKCVGRREERTWPDGEFALEVLQKVFRFSPPAVWLTRDRLEFIQADAWDFIPDTL